MRKITFLKTMLLAVVMMVGSVGVFGQGNETFETQTVITSSYTDGTFSSETAGVTVNFGHSRSTYVSETEDYSITDKGIMLRRASDSYLELVIPSGGVGRFSFKYRKAYTGSSPRQLELLVNGIQVATTSEFGGVSGAETTVYDFSYDVNTAGAVTIKIKNIGTTATNRQTSIDNISWTGFEGAPTEPSISVTPTSLDFGDVNVGESSDAQTVTVACANLTATPSITLANTDFTYTGTLDETGGTLTVTYTPSDAGTSDGILTISGDGITATVTLSGTGVLPPLSAPVATAESGVSQTGFTANWEAVTGATGYELNVYTKQAIGVVELLNETFTWTTNGTGGNDDLWSGNIANATTGISDDLPNWTFIAAYKGNNSIKMGAGSTQGILTTPELGLDGDGTLTFRAGAWNGTNEQTELLLEIFGGGTLDQASVTMTRGAFSNYTVNITGATPQTKITFKGKQASNSRFFLDDVVVTGAASSLSPVTGSPFTGITGTSYAVSGLSNDEVYYYTVTAIRGAERSPLSNEIGPISLLPTGISTLKSDAQAWTSQGKIMIHASVGETIEVFTMTGQKIVSRIAHDGLNTIEPSAKGVLIVKSGNRVSKVIL